jgi:hypothetical protein
MNISYMVGMLTVWPTQLPVPDRLSLGVMRETFVVEPLTSPVPHEPVVPPTTVAEPVTEPVVLVLA